MKRKRARSPALRSPRTREPAPPSALLVAGGLLLLTAVGAPSAGAQERSLAIEDFRAEIRVDERGRVHVLETIRVAFQGSWNGIFRTIPVQYRTPQGLDYHLVLDLESVRGEDGSELRHEVSRERHYRKIKIWVPGASDAVRTVALAYSSPNALRFFEDHDELYWNVTGDEWEVPIHAASATVELPPGVSGLRANAFTGGYGSTEAAADIRETESGYSFSARRPLGFKEGLTVAVAWNPGVVARPTTLQKVARFFRSNGLFLFPLLSLVGMWQIWRSRGRDPERRPVTVQYRPPEGLTPAEAGTLVDGSPDLRDLTATLVDLAVRGHLKIEEKEKRGLSGMLGGTDFTFHRTEPKEPGGGLRAHESAFLAALFPGGTSTRELSDLEQKFYADLPGIRDGVFARLVELRYYEHRPDRVKGAWLGGGLLLAVGAAFAFAALAARFSLSVPAAVVAGALTGLPVLAFALVMPRRTVAGARALEDLLGFQEFLERVESDRYRRMIDSPQMFERYLPYAMALGVEKRWAKAFEDLYTDPPSWYVGSGVVPGRFHTGRFVGDLGTLSTRAGSAMSSAPRSSGGSGFSGGGGGGFSGGGFGGGGGGGF